MIKVTTSGAILPIIAHEVATPIASSVVSSTTVSSQILGVQKAVALLVTHDVRSLKDEYSTWSFFKDDPRATVSFKGDKDGKLHDITAKDYHEGILQLTGLLDPGEVINHATWKRCIERQEITDACIRLNSCIRHIRTVSRLEIEDLMHQPFEMYE